MGSTRCLKVSSGTWHQDVSSISLKSCKLQIGASMDRTPIVHPVAISVLWCTVFWQLSIIVVCATVPLLWHWTRWTTHHSPCASLSLGYPWPCHRLFFLEPLLVGADHYRGPQCGPCHTARRLHHHSLYFALALFNNDINNIKNIDQL